MKSQPRELILILDFGSQYTQLIARRIREAGVYSEIRPYHLPLAEIEKLAPRGIIFSGGPASVYDQNAPKVPAAILELKLPVLGICYGLQLMADLLGGEVAPAHQREYGLANVEIIHPSPLLKDLPTTSRVWMSHGDRLTKLPANFLVLAQTANSPYAVIAHRERPLFGLQFHPEVVHTEQGKALLHNFVYEICQCEGAWSPQSFIEQTVCALQEKYPQQKAICALSGGVDSSVAALLVQRAFGERLTCVFVDNGLLRQGEAEQVQRTFREHFHLKLEFVPAAEQFLNRLQAVRDPEEKRKIIGTEFIRIFEAAARRLGQIDLLVQGTLYPDVIESVSVNGPSMTIKSHHNVGGLPEVMHLQLIEPLRELFKDEVRQVGALLDLPPEILGRHPFPGPGLAVRVLGDVTQEKLTILRQADAIFIQELKTSGYYDQIWQAFAVLLPIQTVGVMGDQRTYEHVIALRAVTSQDGMTADWGRLPAELLATISNRIINTVKGVNRVVYDISTKPPSTIEWE